MQVLRLVVQVVAATIEATDLGSVRLKTDAGETLTMSDGVRIGTPVLLRTRTSSPT